MKKELRQEIESRLYKYCTGNLDTSWMLLIASHVNRMPQDEVDLFRMRYKDRKPERDICRRLHIERSTYYSKVNNIIQDIAILAAFERMITPEGQINE